MDEGGPAGADYARTVLPHAKIAMQTLLVARAVLFFAAIKWRNLTRLGFYLELLIQVVEALMPIDVADGGAFLANKTMLGYLNF